jgi:acyl-coenzyme A thioesterase PaaI-like protein
MDEPLSIALPEDLQRLIPEGFTLLPVRGGDHGCFGCSPTNACGLRMRFFSDGQSVLAPLRVPAHLCGWDRLVHGGVLATILDEVMSWAAIRLRRRVILTKSMQVTFLRPAWVETPLLAQARVADTSSDEREVRMAAELRDAHGKPLSRAEGRLALFTPEAVRRLGIMDEASIQGFLPLLEP